MINRIKDLVFNVLNRQTINLVADESLKNVVVIISGASRGLGRTVAEVLYRQGANLVLFSRNYDELKKACQGYESDRVLLIKADVSSLSDVSKVTEGALRKFGKIDVLINNAGIFKQDYLENITLSEWDRVVGVNIKGAFLMSQAVLGPMKKQKNGLIINIGSRVSHNPHVIEKRVLYATTKYAIEGFSKALNNEVKRSGIRVTCIMPGTLNTFRSLTPKSYLAPHSLGSLISTIIKLKDVDFESVIVKAKSEL